MTLYAATILLGAFLLFLVEPIAGKLLLPRLGGSPAVWNVCMLFFQAALLAGYAYAHALTRWLRPKAQLVTHLVVLIAPLALLPPTLAASSGPPGEGSPIPWLVGTLAGLVGGPFFVLATTGPLLQRWFSATRHARAEDPYVLYAASNLGSLGALLAYPVLIEPSLRLAAGGGLTQTRLFSWGYVAYAILAAAAGVAQLRVRTENDTAEAFSGPAEPIGARRALYWIALAFLPSSATLGVTQYLTTDVAVFPLLWVLPLALYLLTFVLAFSGKVRIPRTAWSVALAVLAAGAVGVFWTFYRPEIGLLLVLHPLLVFVIGMVCHGRLADDRPAASRLTTFYLLLALGGVLGGVFNALVAPLVFRTVLEYPLAVLAACLFLEPSAPAAENAASNKRRSAAAGILGPLARHRWPILTPPALLFLALVMQTIVLNAHLKSSAIVFGLQAGVPCAALLLARRRPVAFVLGLAVLFGMAQTRFADRTLYGERTFFGVLRVSERSGPTFAENGADGQRREFRVLYHALVHGSTRHGMQSLDPRWRRTPNTYFHPTGPIGQVFGAFGEGDRLDHIAVIGLGAGTLAAYGKPGRTFTFYEIDPAVVRIASDPRWFTYLADSASRCEFVTGDGRMTIARAPEGAYGLIVVDAFSSDAIPTHLLTREAIALYVRKLKPGGILALHLTNQNLDLVPVVEALAADAGLAARVNDDDLGGAKEAVEGKEISTWAILARSENDLGLFAQALRWKPIPSSPGAPPHRRYLWTDDYVNLLATLKLD